MTAKTPPIPKAPGALPLVGHAPTIYRAPLRFLSSLPRHGKLVEVQLGLSPTLMVCDTELTRQLFMDARTFDKGGALFDRAREVIGENLITCPHSRHQRQRRLTQPAFHLSRLPGYAAIMSDAVERAVRSWPAGEPVDPVPLMMRLSAEVTARSMFSHDLSERSSDQFVTDSITLVDGIFLRSLLPRSADRLPLPAYRRYEQARRRMDALYRQVISEYRATGGDRGDLLSILLSARDEEAGADTGGARLTDTEVKDQLSGFFIAGTETTASALSWALAALAEHPELQERLRDEVDTVLGGRPAGYDDVERLETTRGILTESLRLHSPVWLLTREVAAETRLGPYTVPAGATVAYSPYLVHRDPALYADPERFDPDRWADGRTPPRHGFVPFASGPRKCIGDVFATIEATLALATFAAHWTWTAAPGSRSRPNPGAVIRPKGLRLRFTARTPRPRHTTGGKPAPTA
ncbi:cytochrome P450 [Streptomyces yaizuensis]|uniref:Cytochrome P450 n=1 Tax=Streptomyces yaizuensis TaxID=2989713 RepID=A0ABQ5NSI5_9ACTN|nr:cytochrome P450 [Streptomyces sp. YSPA8]GLF93110.1 cytochrome P450 [Streptomyces sp. YSPA8]